MRIRHILGACLVASALCGSGCTVESSSGPSPDGDSDDLNNNKDGRPGGGDTETDTSTDSKDGVTPEPGQTDFISADVQSGTPGGRSANDGLSTGAGGSTAAPPAGPQVGEADDSAGNSRSVERGDIFRMLDDGRILNFNAYRGLQVIDVRDPDKPLLEGRLPVTGTPVELYVLEDRAILLLNQWVGYYGIDDSIRVAPERGGLVMVVDISDRTAPKRIDQRLIKGYVSTSRLTRGDGQAALYVASQHSDYDLRPIPVDRADDGVAIGPASETTILTSFDVAGDGIVERNTLDLGGYVQDIQATVDVMMVARLDYSREEETSRVSVVDISDPGGEMILGDEIVTAGIVQNKFNMDVYNGVLRVVSGNTWSGPGNHVETFDAADLGDLKPLDSCTFGGEQQLHATLFVDNRAFFVTYLRQDPFHAFSIADDGTCEEHNEFIVSGWNDFFFAVADDTRLIGVGSNDENNGSTVAVSLYDITELANPEPLIARAEVDLKWSSSEASWDDRAVSVLEDAVSVPSADGVEETGLVLLPFDGSDPSGDYETGVQIFTFSDTSLTLRGVMSQGTPVRRSFLTEPEIAANLSDSDLTLFDAADPDAPDLLGQLDLAPNYDQVLRYGDSVVRVERPMYFYNNRQSLPASVEVLAEGADPDRSSPAAAFEVPYDAQLVQVGDLLASYTTRYVEDASDPTDKIDGYETTLQVYDLSDPLDPKARGELTTNEIQPGYWGYPEPPPVANCFDCLYPYPVQASALATSDALVFATVEQQQKLLGTERRCDEYLNYGGCRGNGSPPRAGAGTAGAAGGGMGGAPAFDGGMADQPAQANPDPVDDPDAPPGEPDTCDLWYDGYRQCIYKDDTEICSGQFSRCTPDGCEEIDYQDLPYPTNRSCYQYDNYRYWQAYSFFVINLEDPDEPVLEEPIVMPKDQAGTGVLASGDVLYFNSEEPFEVKDDPRRYVKRYFQTIDLNKPSAPEVSDRINIPGEVIEVDGEQILTRDRVWDDTEAESLLALLTVDNDRATLVARRLFDDRNLESVMSDGAGHLLASHGPAYGYTTYAAAEYDPPAGGARPDSELHRLSMLSLVDLTVLGEADIDSWASLVAAEAGRALFSVNGGLLMVNVEDPEAPAAQAYFATNGYYGGRSVLFDDGHIVVAGGPYGIYRFSIDESNLLTK